MGAFTNIEVPDTGSIKGLSIGVDITHPNKGDLSIKLQKLLDPTEVILIKPDASTGSFAPRTFTVPDFNGKDMKGTWRLTVIDAAAGGVGTINNWSIDVQN